MSTAKQYASKAKVTGLLSVNILKFRSEANLTQKQLALKCGVSQSSIDLIEKAELLPTLYSVILISDALNKTLSEMFDENN